jgi:hypothetical protein
MNTMETYKERKGKQTHMNVTREVLGRMEVQQTDCTHAHTRTTKVGKKGKRLPDEESERSYVGTETSKRKYREDVTKSNNNFTTIK